MPPSFHCRPAPPAAPARADASTALKRLLQRLEECAVPQDAGVLVLLGDPKLAFVQVVKRIGNVDHVDLVILRESSGSARGSWVSAPSGRRGDDDHGQGNPQPVRFLLPARVRPFEQRFDDVSELAAECFGADRRPKRRRDAGPPGRTGTESRWADCCERPFPGGPLPADNPAATHHRESSRHGIALPLP